MPPIATILVRGTIRRARNCRLLPSATSASPLSVQAFAVLPAPTILRCWATRLKFSNPRPSRAECSIFGIPQFRLPREIIKMEVDNILAMGVTLHTRVTLGRDISFAELRSKFDAVLLATGLNKGRELNIPGAHLQGVYNGIDFLINVNLGFEIELGKRVVVVGGGNVAIDVARAAVRLVHEQVDFAEQDDDAKGLQPAFDAARMALRSGAQEVDMVSLESRAQMPAWKGEVEEAEHEGIVVDNGWGPKEIVGENGVVTGLRVRHCLTVFDENGRFKPAFSDEEKIIPCDSVILAIGQQADLRFLPATRGCR